MPTPKELKDPFYCSKHPEYKAKRAPKSGCARCIGIFALRNLKQPPTPVVAPRKKVNRIAFVFDRSGSMSGYLAAAVKALNDSVRTIREEAQRTGQETYVSLVSFDDQIEFLYSNVPVSAFPTIQTYQVQARNQTAIYDGTLAGIETLQGAPYKFDDESYLVMVLTDGQENASRRSQHELKSTMAKLNSTDRWTFTFLVPPGSKYSTVHTLGLSDGNVMEWEQSTRGVETYSKVQTQAIGNYYALRSAGKTSTNSFYTDLSKLTSSQVKRNLDDLSSKVRVLPVEKEVDIKTFVESKVGQYIPGSAFYQLTKDEKKVQAYKELLVMEKGKKAVYGGPDARQVLGIPQGQDLKIKPGNHGNFDIFVQSTSQNRKLVRGTKLLVRA